MAFILTSEPANTDTSFVQAAYPLCETLTVCLPAGSLRVAGALPTKPSSTYTSAPSGTELRMILPSSFEAGVASAARGAEAAHGSVYNHAACAHLLCAHLLCAHLLCAHLLLTSHPSASILHRNQRPDTPLRATDSSVPSEILIAASPEVCEMHRRENCGEARCCVKWSRDRVMKPHRYGLFTLSWEEA